MSSETSTSAQTLPPWQLFALAGLVGATIVVFVSRGQSPAAIILLSLVVFAAAAVGAAALRTLLPFASPRTFATAPVLGGRTRAAIEREKVLVLRSIKELEFDHAMGKVSAQDFAEMGARLRARAAGLLLQLDAGTDYRRQIEQEVARRLAVTGQAPRPVVVADDRTEESPDMSPSAARFCTQCGAPHDLTARFCGRCGHRLSPA